MNRTLIITAMAALVGWICFFADRCSRVPCAVDIDTIITIQKDTIFLTNTAPTLISEKKIYIPFEKFRDTCNGKVYDSDSICKEYIAFVDSFYKARTYSDTGFSDSTLYLKYTAYVRGRLDSISIAKFIHPVKVTVKSTVIPVQYIRLFGGVGYSQTGTTGVPTIEADLNYKQWLFGVRYGKDVIGGKIGYTLFKIKTK